MPLSPLRNVNSSTPISTRLATLVAAVAAEIARKKNWQKPYGPYEWADYNNAVLVRNSSYARAKMEYNLGDQHDIVELEMSNIFDPKYWKVTAYRNKRKQGLWTVFKFFVREQWHKPLGLRTALKVRRDIISGVYQPAASRVDSAIDEEYKNAVLARDKAYNEIRKVRGVGDTHIGIEVTIPEYFDPKVWR